MLRTCFSSASILALTMVMLAADVSQAQGLRLLGRRNRTYNNDYYNSPSAPVDRSMSEPEMQGGVRQSLYTAPETMPGAKGDMPVYLDVRLPMGALVTIEGEKTSQSGSRRLFISPPVAPGKRYVYDVTAKWMQDGREMSRSSKVYVHAGETVQVDLRPTLNSPPQQPQQRAPLLRRRST
jgi:uncharacterized protein (TIGR03000 family)